MIIIVISINSHVIECHRGTVSNGHLDLTQQRSLQRIAILGHIVVRKCRKVSVKPLRIESDGLSRLSQVSDLGHVIKSISPSFIYFFVIFIFLVIFAFFVTTVDLGIPANKYISISGKSVGVECLREITINHHIRHCSSTAVLIENYSIGLGNGICEQGCVNIIRFNATDNDNGAVIALVVTDSIRGSIAR